MDQSALVLLPLAVLTVGWLISWLAGAPAYKGMIVVLLIYLIQRVSGYKGPWLSIFIYSLIFWLFILKGIYWLLIFIIG